MSSHIAFQPYWPADCDTFKYAKQLAHRLNFFGKKIITWLAHDHSMVRKTNLIGKRQRSLHALGCGLGVICVGPLLDGMDPVSQFIIPPSQHFDAPSRLAKIGVGSKTTFTAKTKAASPKLCRELRLC